MAARLILNIAVSLDGYLADKAGGYAWITGHGDAGQNTRAQFCFETFLAGCGTVVMGRNAYDDCGIEHIDGWQEKHFLWPLTARAPQMRRRMWNFSAAGLPKKWQSRSGAPRAASGCSAAGRWPAPCFARALWMRPSSACCPLFWAQAAGCLLAKCQRAFCICRNAPSQTALPCCTIQTGAGLKTGPSACRKTCSGN